jgi:excisionase family DNA binding protein
VKVQEASYQMNKEKLIDAEELANFLKISLRTLNTLIAENKVPMPMRVGRLRRWTESEVMDWLESNRDKPSPQ